MNDLYILQIPLFKHYSTKYAIQFIEFIINHPEKQNISWELISLNTIITPEILEMYNLPWKNKKNNINCILSKYYNIKTFFNDIHTINNCSYEIYIINTLLCYHKSYKELVNFIKEHNIYYNAFNWRDLISANIYLTWDYIYQDLINDPTKILLWNWEYISKHKCITPEIFEKYKTKYPFDILYLSSNSNFNLEYVLKHSEIEWNIYGLSINKNMTINNYILHSKYFDKQYFGMNPNNSIDDLKLLDIKTDLFSYNPTLTITQIINNPNIKWNLLLICRNNMNISKYNYIKQKIYNKSLIILYKLQFKYNFYIDILQLILSFI